MNRAPRVLVVEDEWIIAAETEEILTSAGYEVAGPTPTAEAALRLLHEEKVDAALLDVHLTHEKSYAVAERLIDQGTPFVFASGFAVNDLPARFQAVPLISKPFSPQRMLAALQSVLVRDWRSFQDP